MSSPAAIGRRALALAAVAAVAAGCQTRFEVDRHAIFFAEDSDALDDAAQTTLREIAASLRERPANDIAVEGYSEAGGAAPEGRVPLSERRAIAVARALASFGVPPEQMRTIGMGPVTTLALPIEGRRVDITIQRRVP